MLLLQVDASLSFLDDYVSEALERGATPYKPAHMRKAERSEEKTEEGKHFYRESLYLKFDCVLVYLKYVCRVKASV